MCPHITKDSEIQIKRDQMDKVIMVPNCKNKDKCSFSHAESEIKFHPLIYIKEQSVLRNEKNGPEFNQLAKFYQ